MWRSGNTSLLEELEVGTVRVKGQNLKREIALLVCCIPEIVWNIITFDSHRRTISVEDSFLATTNEQVDFCLQYGMLWPKGIRYMASSAMRAKE